MSELSLETRVNTQDKLETTDAVNPRLKEQQRKGAFFYVWLLMMNRSIEQLPRKENKDAIRKILQFKKNRPADPSHRIAYDYWARRILLGKTR